MLLRNALRLREIEKAKAEIINGIKEYDAAHPDEKGGSEDE